MANHSHIGNRVQKKENKKVLFIMRLPPPFGGGEILNEIIFNAFKNNNGYYFLLLKRKKHSKMKQSYPNLIAFIFGVYYILRFMLAILIYNPTKIHISLPKTFGAYFRNTIIIQLASFLKKEVNSELHGMNFYFLENQKFKKFYVSSINKINKLRVLSTGIKETIIASGFKNQIYVIDNGLYVPDKFISKKENVHESLNILYFGAISKPKGFKRVLEIINYIDKQRVIDCKLTVIGEWVSKSFRYESQKYIEENKIGSIIDFKGLLLKEEKWEAISQNHLLLHLTESDGQPLTIIEAMGLGVPSLATKIGAIPEMIVSNYNGFLIDDYLYDSIKTIKDIIKGDIDYKMIKKNARSTYEERFREDLYIRNIANFVND